MSTRRILFVIDGLGRGGAEKSTLTLAGDLVQQGHAVTVVSLRDEQAYAIPEGVRMLSCYDTARGPFRKPAEIRRRARALDTLVGREPGWDLVVSTLPATDRIVGRSVLRDAWYRIPNHLSSERLARVGPLRRWRRRRRLRRVYDGRRIIVISAGLRRDLADLAIAPARVEVIPNPFDIARVRRLAAEPCPAAGADYLVHVGRFKPQKRHDRLLAAFARSDYRGRLLLLGSGDASGTAAIQTQIAARGLGQRVELLGFQANPYPYLEHARALVLSSDYEGFGRVIVEALICRTPVVSTDCPSGPAEILTGALATGLADRSVESLAAAIDRVVRTPPVIEPAHYERYAVASIRERYLALIERD